MYFMSPLFPLFLFSTMSNDNFTNMADLYAAAYPPVDIDPTEDAMVLRDFVVEWWVTLPNRLDILSDVAITGSCALKLYCLRYPPKTRYNGNFVVDDLDLVYAGKYDYDYIHGVGSFCSYLAGLSVDFSVAREISRDDIKPGVVVRITNFRIWTEADVFNISFIYYPEEDNSMMHVIRDYDIDIVQVAFMMGPRTFLLAQGTRTEVAISKSEARVVRSFVFGTVPTPDEVKSLQSTLSRIVKYSDRGFRFKTRPVVTFESD